MSKNEKRPTAEIINPGLGDIEKVRDILFGRYVESFERRFEELEARLEADVDKLKDRLIDKIASMDSAVNESLAKLDQQIDNEKATRDSELNDLQSSLQQAETALQHSISLMEDQASQDFSAVRASMKEGHQELMDKSVALQTELTSQIEQQQSQLEGDKVSRQTLALMLDEVAVKLRGS